MYKPGISLVNGEIIKDLLDLCNDYFIEPFIKPYAGANSECRFCGATEKKRDNPMEMVKISKLPLRLKKNKAVQPIVSVEIAPVATRVSIDTKKGASPLTLNIR